MDVFHGNLEAIEAASFRDLMVSNFIYLTLFHLNISKIVLYLNFLSKSLDKIFIDNSIRGSKEGKNMRNKVSLIGLKVYPIFHVLKQRMYTLLV